MARFNSTVESTTALVATVPSGASANGLFANLVCTAAAASFKMRRVTIGVRAGTGAPTSQQMTVALYRTSARQTQTGTFTPGKLDPTSAASNCAMDYAWSTVPTATPSAVWAAPYVYEVSFNTQSGVDLPWELLEELVVQSTGVNSTGMAFINVGNALPTSHLYSLSVEWEE
jgi:hypothetical protein